MSVDLAKDIAYIPKVCSGSHPGCQDSVGYVAITDDSLYFVPYIEMPLNFAPVLCEDTDDSDMETVIHEGVDPKEFWRIIPVLAQQLEADTLEKVIRRMADSIEGSQKLELSDVKEFRFGLMGLEAVLDNGNDSMNFEVGLAPKKRKRIQGFLKQKGLLT